MDMIERYLQAVKFWLPKAQREDIAAELSEDLHARIEELEAALGRPLQEDEVVALLRQTGAPVLVAGRYRPQQSLIGPVLFPVYLFALKVMAVCYALPWAFTVVGLMVGIHAGFFQAWSRLFGHAVTSCFVGFSIVTLVFAAIERLQARIPSLRQEPSGSFAAATWDPRQLPPLQDPRRIPRFSSISEIVANLIFAGWWVSGMWMHTIFAATGIQVVFGGAWRSFFWGFLILAVANVVAASVNLSRPFWTKERALLRLGLDSAGSVLCCGLLKARLLLEISSTSLAPARAAEIVSAINNGMARCFPFAVLTCIIVLVATDVSRLVKLRSRDSTGYGSFGHRSSV